MKLQSACLVLGAAMAFTAPVWAQSKAITPTSIGAETSLGPALIKPRRATGTQTMTTGTGTETGAGTGTRTTHIDRRIPEPVAGWPADRAVAVQFAAPAEWHTGSEPGPDRRHERQGRLGPRLQGDEGRRACAGQEPRSGGQWSRSDQKHECLDGGDQQRPSKLDAKRWPDVDWSRADPVVACTLPAAAAHGGGRYASGYSAHYMAGPGMYAGGMQGGGFQGGGGGGFHGGGGGGGHGHGR